MERDNTELLVLLDKKKNGISVDRRCHRCGARARVLDRAHPATELPNWKGTGGRLTGSSRSRDELASLLQDPVAVAALAGRARWLVACGGAWPVAGLGATYSSRHWRWYKSRCDRRRMAVITDGSCTRVCSSPL